MEEFAFAIGILGLFYIVLVCATDANFKKGLGDFICNDKSDRSDKK